MAGFLFTAWTVVLLIRRRLPLPLNVYTAAVLAPCLLYSTVGLRPRFIDAAYPLFLVLALSLPRRWFLPVLGAGVVGLVCLTGVYLGGTAIP
jgi:hypothetical protein